MNRRPVRGGEADRFRDDQRGDREVLRQRAGVEDVRMRSVESDERCLGRLLRSGRHVGDRVLAGRNRGPFERGAGGDFHRRCAIHRHAEEMPPVVVIFRGSGIRVINHGPAVATLGDMLDHERAWREQERRAPG